MHILICYLEPPQASVRQAKEIRALFEWVDPAKAIRKESGKGERRVPSSWLESSAIRKNVGVPHLLFSSWRGDCLYILGTENAAPRGRDPRAPEREARGGDASSGWVVYWIDGT